MQNDCSNVIFLYIYGFCLIQEASLNDDEHVSIQLTGFVFGAACYEDSRANKAELCMNRI